MCTACSWYCTVSDNHLGICQTKLNKNGILYSLVYGRPVGLHLDSVEKKPLHHFLPGTRLLSFGTIGCNFGCLFCQNWDISQINKLRMKSEKLRVDAIRHIISEISQTMTPRQIVDMAINAGAKGIAYTYNEPAIFTEFAHDTAEIAKENGLVNVFVSNGYESKETFEYIKGVIDAINIDLKSYRNDFYRLVCKAKLKPVLDSIERYFSASVVTEVTTLIIPGYNDSTDELTNISQFLFNISPDIPWHISAFYPSYKLKDMPPTSRSSLLRAYEIGKETGLHHVYVGNINDQIHSSTYCPKCQRCLIERNGYDMRMKDDFTSGTCRCGTRIYGSYST